ncbi:MAG: helix-turn-helix transcriptional regulator [Verrucomicrobia bacterium]|nr:helix-turn-helix transcriptional regulator [Verrucomicrobiota bacterium]
MSERTIRNHFPAVAVGEHRPFDRIREFYLYQEPALLAAIKLGDRREARRIINHLLVHIYSAGEERSELLKGLLLELVVMISRAAVEAGASQTELLGMRFAHLAELAEIDDDEALAAWLRGTLERIFTAMERQQRFEVPVLVTSTLRHMREHIVGELTREDLARQVGISPGHLTQLLKERTGRTFVELLREVRVQVACELLVQTEKPLAEVAADCGFCDQSYLTHVFRDLRGMTPKQYRDRSRTTDLNATSKNFDITP